MLPQTPMSASDHPRSPAFCSLQEEVPSEISAEDRATIKAHLVNLMATVPELVQRQLADALSIISKRDFPAEWPTLLPELVARLGTGDVSVTAGVMETAASIFSRFVEADNRDDVRLVLRYCLDNFAVPLLSTATAFTTRVDEATAAGASRAVLEPYLRILRHCTSIFYSLSWLEMPDVFQDHLPAWMAFFRKFLTYTNPLLSAASEDDEEGPLEAFQAAILDVIALCADKHDEDFEPFFATFAGDVWTLLSGTATSRIMASNMDSLVIQAVRFLTASVSKSMHVDFFKVHSSSLHDRALPAACVPRPSIQAIHKYRQRIRVSACARTLVFEQCRGRVCWRRCVRRWRSPTCFCARRVRCAPCMSSHQSAARVSYTRVHAHVRVQMRLCLRKTPWNLFVATLRAPTMTPAAALRQTSSAACANNLKQR